MLGAPLPAVRRAVETLAERGELTAESFVFAEHSWRIAPSDVKRVQALVREWAKGAAPERPQRRIKARRIVTPSDPDES
jgi:hypothetical protein